MYSEEFASNAKIIDALIEKFGDPKAEEIKKNEDEESKQVMDYSHEEDQVVEEFLSKFLIANESPFLDTIDIVLMLRALPSPINDFDKV